MTQRSSQSLLSVYSRARRTGILDFAIPRALFVESYFAYKRYLEDPFAKLLKRQPALLGRGDILDIGANIGYTATLFARSADPDAKVYAFEPEAFNFQILAKKAKRTSGVVIPIQSAVGAHEGVVEIWVNESSHADHRVVTPALSASGRISARASVPMVSVDSFAKANQIAAVSFVKIDVQGYELEVCAGMENTIQGNPDIRVAVEYMPSAMEELGYEGSNLLAWFRDRGFDFKRICRDGQLRDGLGEVRGANYVDLLFFRQDRPREF
jgi:FkbM family methyltransferase